MTDIGPGRRTRVPVGWQHATTDGCFLKVTGWEIAAASNMTIDGTATTIGITNTAAEAQARAVAEDDRRTVNHLQL